MLNKSLYLSIYLSIFIYILTLGMLRHSHCIAVVFLNVLSEANLFQNDWQLKKFCIHCVCSRFRAIGSNDDVIKWKHIPRYWPFVRGIHMSPVNSPHKGQWRGALMFSLIYTWINGWVNNRQADDLRHHRAHYDVIVKANIYTGMVMTMFGSRYIPNWFNYLFEINLNSYLYLILCQRTSMTS